MFISFIPANGAAYESGQLRKGDQILSVNGTDMRGANREKAAEILRSCGKEATLRVVHRYDGKLNSRGLLLHPRLSPIDFLRLETQHGGSQAHLNKKNADSANNVQIPSKRELYVQ